jgi:GTPase SAR1 family protein
LQEYNTDAKKILVGNKVDRSAERQVTTEAGAALAKEYNMDFFETSAKIDKNVDEAFLTLADMAAVGIGLASGSDKGFKVGGDGDKKKKCDC